MSNYKRHPKGHTRYTLNKNSVLPLQQINIPNPIPNPKPNPIPNPKQQLKKPIQKPKTTKQNQKKPQTPIITKMNGITRMNNMQNNRNSIYKEITGSNSNNMNNNMDNMDNNLLQNLLALNSNGVIEYKYYNPKDDSTVNKDPKRCMCINYKSMDDFKSYDRCINKVINDTDFCQLHQNCKSYLRQFLSGSEPEPDQTLWKDPLIEGSHNCYSYFLNRQVKAVKEKCSEICNKKYNNIDECIDDSGCGDLKPQPGDFNLIKRTGTDKTKKRIYRCPEMQQKIINDNPSIFPVEFNKKCPSGYYKGAMTLEPDSTYHFYKQINDGMFFHKPGLNPVSKVDSKFTGEKGRPIYIPHFANRDYTANRDDDDGINYTSFCSYYCIPQNNLVHKNLA